MCSQADLIHRKSYNNHVSIGAHDLAVLAKVISRVVNPFLLIFPIYGMFLIPISFILRKDKGRIMVDPSTQIHNADYTGVFNQYMERTDPEQVPSTFYSST